MFEVFPGAEETQLSFWTMYKDTFTPYAGSYQLLLAADIIRNVTIQFPQAHAIGTNQKFVIQNIRRRPKQVERRQFRCQWDHGTCLETAFETAPRLHAHILTVHLPPSMGEPLRPCSWAGCPLPASPLESLRLHVLTHIPAPNPPTKHALQPPTITLPYEEYPNPSPNPTARPPPPPPIPMVQYLTPGSPTPGPALLALYALRLLFWAAFPSNAAATIKPDENRFGFPALPSSLREQKEERGQEEIKEAERRGRIVFRNAKASLEEVMVADEGIMEWIADILVKTEDVLDGGALVERNKKDTDEPVIGAAVVDAGGMGEPINVL